METETKPVAAKAVKRPRKPAAQPVAESVAPVVPEVAEVAEPSVAEVVEILTKKTKKDNKIKVIRDSFTMPQSEYQKIGAIKESCLKAGRHVKKSEVLRAGLQALVYMSETELHAAIAKLETIPTGRPKKR